MFVFVPPPSLSDIPSTPILRRRKIRFQLSWKKMKLVFFFFVGYARVYIIVSRQAGRENKFRKNAQRPPSIQTAVLSNTGFRYFYDYIIVIPRVSDQRCRSVVSVYIYSDLIDTLVF